MTNNFRETPVQIVHQGAPLINNAIVEYENDSVALVRVDLHSKWCEVVYTDSDAHFGISSTEDSCHLLQTQSKDEPTEIHLPQFSEWKIWTTKLSRYTLDICFMKEIN